MTESLRVRRIHMPKLVTLLAALCVLLAIAPAPAAAADNLGRLFFTPQQRLDLDRRRQANIQESGLTAESLITVNGKVSRSSGKTTVWVNGVPLEGIGGSRDPAHVTLPGGEGESSVRLKVGETHDRGRGDMKDPLEGGKIVVPSGKRGPAP